MNFFQVGCSKQLNKTHKYFRKIIFVTSSLWNSLTSISSLKRLTLTWEVNVCSLSALLGSSQGLEWGTQESEDPQGQFLYSEARRDKGDNRTGGRKKWEAVMYISDWGWLTGQLTRLTVHFAILFLATVSKISQWWHVNCNKSSYCTSKCLRNWQVEMTLFKKIVFLQPSEIWRKRWGFLNS